MSRRRGSWVSLKGNVSRTTLVATLYEHEWTWAFTGPREDPKIKRTTSFTIKVYRSSRKYRKQTFRCTCPYFHQHIRGVACIHIRALLAGEIISRPDPGARVPPFHGELTAAGVELFGAKVAQRLLEGPR